MHNGSYVIYHELPGKHPRSPDFPCIGDGRLSLPTLFLDEHKRQDDVVQHVHPFRLHLEPRFSFLGEIVFPVKLSDHCLLLVHSDQLDTEISAQNLCAG